MTYQVLARSWRPQRFGDLLGQDAAVRTLQNAIGADTLGHAYLFSGLRGVGKTTVARLLAKAVNCAAGPTADPCGECESCTEIAAGSSLDVVELDGASNRGIDDVRELRELLRYRPTRDRYRVIIIDEVHMLTREAFNALLKSLEEPPPYILFIFATTERHKVPGTILSRCQQLEFRPVSQALITERLRKIADQEGFGLSIGAAEMVARASEGSVRDGLSLIDQLRAFSGDQIDEEAVAEVLGVPRFEAIAGLVELLVAGRAAEALGMIRTELLAAHDCTVLYQEVGRVLRAMVHLSLDPELEPSLTEEHRARLLGLVEPFGSGALARMLGLWLDQEGTLRDARSREVALEVACLRLTRWPAIRRIEALLDGNAGVPGTAAAGSTPAGTVPASGTSSSAPPAPAAGSPAASASASSSRSPHSALVGDSESVPESDGSATSRDQDLRARAEAPATGEPVPDAEPAASPVSADGSAECLGQALEESSRHRLASAVESAAADLESGTLVLTFSAENETMYRFAADPERARIIEATAAEVVPGVEEVRLHLDGVCSATGEPTLEAQAIADPQVQLALEVLGGTVSRVTPDYDPGQSHT